MRNFVLLYLALSMCGCARWRHPEKPTEFRFPQGRMAKDAVAIEIGIVQLDISQVETFEEFWKTLDQQAVDLPFRKRLDQNGIRVGIMASHAPATLNELLEPRPIELEVLDAVEQQMADRDMLEPKPRMIVHQRINNRNGQAHPIQTSDIQAAASWTVHQGDRQIVGSGELVRGFVEIITLPQGDGTVRIKLNPQIHHGQVKPTIGVADRSFFFDTSQTITKLTDLNFGVDLRPGESLMLAPTSDVADLGALFFGPANAPGEGSAADKDQYLTHRMLMIRLVQTQMDNLFGEIPELDRLTTTSDH
jgi:hypothetical protein